MSCNTMDITYTCSLGSLCHSSQLLKRNLLKKESYPFDWIHMDPDMVLHCLRDKFSLFLDKSKYVRLLGNRCGHTYYHEKMFNHHNPLNKEDYDYYVRCVNRFKRLLRQSDRKLFVLMLVNLDKIETEEMIRFNETFSTYTKNYTLLVIHHRKQSTQSHRFTRHKNIDFLELHTVSESDGVVFLDERDNAYLDHVLMTQYRFNVKPLKGSYVSDVLEGHASIVLVLVFVLVLGIGIRKYRPKLSKYRYSL